jgi:hypothetical protein
MGLDMYVYRTAEKIAKIGTERPFDTTIPENKYIVDGKLDWDKYRKLLDKVRICYWRKHADLHGWFQQLWASNGGKPASDYFGDNFNGGDWVRIDSEDLDTLEASIKGKNLPHTTGFFFGTSYGDADEKAYDLKFISKARRQLAKGYSLFYTSSW